METETMEDRLVKLERAARHYQLVLACIGIAVLVCAVVYVALGAADRAQAQKQGETGKAISAREFILEDEQGRIRATLCMTEYGPGLFLYDEKSTPRAKLVVTDEGPGLGLYDEKGNPRAKLDAFKDNEPWLRLYDGNNNARAVLSAGGGGTFLALSDVAGKLRATMGVGDAEGPTLGLYDKSGRGIWGGP